MLRSCLSGVTFHTPLPSTSFTSNPRTILWRGEETMVSPTFPLSCRELSFVSCIPLPIHLFLSLSPLLDRKKPYSLTRGRGMSVRLKKPLSAICRYPPSPLNATSSPFPPRFTWLVKQQSSKKGRRKKRCILSLPLAVSQCVPGLSCGLFLMTG